MNHILLIDNYDSFTFNLVQLLRESKTCTFEVVYNDAISPGDGKFFDKIMISPGPGLPHEAGITCGLIRHWAGMKSILGICLGHQAIGEVFGAKLKRLRFPKHGTAEEVIISDPASYLFEGLPEKFLTGHYHSWVLDPTGFPTALKIIATDTNGNIMAISHQIFDVHGVQFHPESIMTHYGKQIILNFLTRTTS